MKPHSARSGSPKTPRRTPKGEEVQAKKPAIIGSQSTAVAVQLASRPANKPPRASSRVSHAVLAKSRASSLKYVIFCFIIYCLGHDYVVNAGTCYMYNNSIFKYVY